MNLRILTAAVMTLTAAVSASALPAEQADMFSLSDKSTAESARNIPAGGESAEIGSTLSSARGITDLMRASLAGDAAAVNKLIHSGAEVNAADRLGRTALMYALSRNEGQQAAEALLQAGADVNYRGKKGFPPLMYALHSGYSPEFISELIEKYGGLPEVTAEGGITPMMAACQYAGSAETVKILYRAGAELRFPDGRGRTPLHYAVLNQSSAAASIAAFLLENRAPLEAKDARGMTPLSCAAAWSSNAELIETLLNAGAALESTDSTGMTPLMHAASRSGSHALEAVQIFAEAGADFTARDRFGYDVFLCALRSCGSLETVLWIDGHMKTLKAAEEAAGSAGSAENTERDGTPEPLPLLTAALNPTEAAPDIIRWLLSRVEPLEERDENGRTALVRAVRYNASPLAAEALASAGASLKVRWKGASWRQLLRYNSVMEAADKVSLAAFFRKLKK